MAGTSQDALGREIIALALRAGEAGEPCLETALVCAVKLLALPPRVQGLITSATLMSFMMAECWQQEEP